MAKRGCRRVLTMFFSASLLLLLAFSKPELSLVETASASSVWVQDSSDDFLNGTLSNVEIKEYEDEVILRLNRTTEWSNVTPANSPSPRRGHSMVFDESANATVLFGGRNDTIYFQDTWLYFSGNNTWVEVTPPGSPTPREGHAMAYDSENELIIMFGGYDGSDYISQTWTYSVNGNVWMNLNPGTHPSKRAWTAMSYDRENDCVILFGGLERLQQSGDTWKYELSGNTWTPLFPTSFPRQRHGHSMIYDESLGLHVMTGGIVGGIVWSDTWTYNSTSIDWEPNIFGSSFMPRSNHSLVYESVDGVPYLFGGYGNSTANQGDDRLVPLPCSIPSSDKATTILEHEGHLYIGTSNASNQARIYRYDLSSKACIEWMNANVYYVYSSGSYGGVAFWGTRSTLVQTDGPLLYFDGTTFGIVPATWFSTIPPFSGWVQDFEIFKGKMYVSGSTMAAVPGNDNNLFVKYCDNPPCLSSSDWHWTDTSTANLGLLDDAIVLEEFNGELYLGTYDWAAVLKYYESNQTWWYCLNGSVDGDTSGLKGGYGIFGLANYSGGLHALTYHNGWHWTSQDGTSWTGFNESMGSFTRAFVFEDRLYAGLSGLTTNQLASYYGSSWSSSSSSEDSFLYFAEALNTLFISSGNEVLRRETYHNDFWEYQEGTWLQVSDTASPSPRESFGIAFDKQNSVVVLFGGADEYRFYGDTHVYSKTVGSGVFTSETFDSGDTSLETHWQSLSWSRADQPSGSSIKFQLASNNDNSTWTYKGPDGNTGSYYVNPVSEAIWTGHHGDRFLRFRAYFTATSPVGPVLDRVEITYDHTPAGPSLIEPFDDIWTDDNSPQFVWSFDDFDPGDHQSGFRVQISDNLSFDEIAFDSGNQDGTNEYWQLPSSLADGIWFWKVRTKDADGIWGAYSTPFTLKIDTEAPSSAVTNPASSSYLNSIGLISGTSSDAHSGVESVELRLKDQGDMYWNGSSWQNQEEWLSCAGAIAWSFDASSVNWISEREYTVTTRATDVAGNMEAPATAAAFIYDTTPPSVTLLNPVGSESPEGGKNIEIKWTASDAYLNLSSVQIGYSIDGGTTWNSIADGEINDGSHNWTLPRMKSDMRIMVEAKDLAGNTGQDMSGVFYVRAPMDEEDWLHLYWWLILIVVLIAIGLAIYYWRKMSTQPEEEITGPPPIVATAGETTLCAVCLGTVKEGLSVIKCGDCGKTFHEKCAARIEKCPNCDSKLDMSELEEE